MPCHSARQIHIDWSNTAPDHSHPVRRLLKHSDFTACNRHASGVEKLRIEIEILDYPQFQKFSNFGYEFSNFLFEITSFLSKSGLPKTNLTLTLGRMTHWNKSQNAPQSSHPIIFHSLILRIVWGIERAVQPKQRMAVVDFVSLSEWSI